MLEYCNVSRRWVEIVRLRTCRGKVEHINMLFANLLCNMRKRVERRNYLYASAICCRSILLDKTICYPISKQPKNHNASEPNKKYIFHSEHCLQIPKNSNECSVIS